MSYACPWAQRALITRALKGLQPHIGVTAVHWHMGDKGWRFVTSAEQRDGSVPGDKDWLVPDPLHEGFSHLRDVYFDVDGQYTGRFTVPTLYVSFLSRFVASPCSIDALLFYAVPSVRRQTRILTAQRSYDKKQKTIVSNESADIIRMLYHEFDSLLGDQHASLDLLPHDLKDAIDAANEWIYPQINNGVYRSGFATTQEAYEAAVAQVFEGLDRAEQALKTSGGPFWFGDRLTEVDVRLYPTIVRYALYSHNRPTYCAYHT